MPDRQERPTPDPDRRAEMADDDVERLLVEAFTEFRSTHRDTLPAPGVQQVFAAARTAQRRRRQLSALAAAAAVAAIVGAVTVSTGLNPAPTDRSADGRPTVTAPGPPSLPPSASQTPSSSPSSPSATRPPAPARQIDLRNATVTIGPLERAQCPGGVLTFRDGSSSDTAGCLWRLGDGPRRYASVDGVTGEEVVTTLRAGHPAHEFVSAVVALRPTGAGELDSIGYVFVAEHAYQWVDGVSVSDGVIAVTIADTSAEPGHPQRQTRYYQWTGGGFQQVGGPTSFPVPGGTGPSPAPESPTPGDGATE